MTFSELNLLPALLKAVSEAGYKTPSPIQAGAIPPVLAGRDLMGCAQTGTGKTAAFALPILQSLSDSEPKPAAIRALILTPTRELALQIGESFSAYGKHLKLRHTVIFGGVGQQPQVEALRKGTDILIACPGRLNDLIGQQLVDLSCIEIFVLDEADRMLDMGFVHDVKKIIAKLPRRRQTLLFSATMPREIEELADSMLRKPAVVKVDPVSSTVEKIDQKLYYVEKKQKAELLAWLLQDPSIQNALVFSRTKHGADRIARLLNKAGISSAAIHGNKSQSARVAALDGFKAGKTRVLVATDIAARGIDINELSHVFNYDLPEVPETYVHRIGRTARAGADGVAISFCASEEREYLAGIEKLNRKKIPTVTGHPWENVSPAVPEKSAAHARKTAQTARPVHDGTSPAEKSVRPESEVIMDKQENRPSAGEGKGLSASAKRRRRRRRALDRDSAAGQTSGGTAPAAEKSEAKKPLQESRKGQGDGSHSRNTASGTQSSSRRQEPKKAQQPASKAGEAHREKAQQTRREKNPPSRPQPSQRGRAAQQSNDDPGLLLISRKPPAQKFASFEAYMEAHGGATAPIVGEDEE